ncbi:hypothetical protein [Pseudarthrobacter equi]|uniref:hypothetical protein n=1 Tax=Pseudarthrobacter equi TaxID=728066 RepID=UPI0028D4E0AF|nr:hypothetical protein [Pseudarthrobacter equi]
MSSWKSFWEKGGWWRAVLLAAVYFVLYNLCSLAFGPLLAGVADKDGADFIFFAVALPVLVGCIMLAFSDGRLVGCVGYLPVSRSVAAAGCGLPLSLFSRSTSSDSPLSTTTLPVWISWPPGCWLACSSASPRRL